VGTAKKSCVICGNSMIGRSRARYCSPACKQRAHRSRMGASRNASARRCVTVRAPRRRGGRSAEAVALLASLDDELKENSEDRGLIGDDVLSWAAAERVVLDMVADAVDRKVDLCARYLATDDDKVRVKLSTEIRLIEGSVAKLLKSVSTDLPEPQSKTSRKASAAAHARWRHGSE
jgi:hypothetical protein